MNKNHKFPYRWNLKAGYPAKKIDAHNLKAFGAFICGGGSTMGCKLAGYNHLGGIEIDSKVANAYRVNHQPKYLFIEDIRDFNKRKDLPKELYHLDYLETSPPCSSFSMAGNREKDWGKKKRFAEGQKIQRLDNLVFDAVTMVEKLQPKVVVLENVKGIIQGNAKVISKSIASNLKKAGYRVQVFLLNAASMGVPQKRERVFFIGLRKDFDYLPKLNLKFDEPIISFRQVENQEEKRKPVTGERLKYLKLTPPGKSLSTAHPKGNLFTSIRLSFNDVSNTIASGSSLFHPTKNEHISNAELKLIGSYPLDYDFQGIQPKYLIGMSVPPVMQAQIAHQIYLQWLSEIKT